MGGFFMSDSQARQLACWKKNPAEGLFKMYGEIPYAYMITAEGYFQTVFLNIKKGNYTIVLTPPDEKIFCLVGSGEDWNHFTVETKKPIL